MNKPSGNDYLTYYTNHFLSSDEGKAILNKVFKDDHELKKQITRQLEVHSSIINKQSAQEQPVQQQPPMQQVALADEQPLIPGQYVHIPQNINRPVQQGNIPQQPQLPPNPLLRRS